MKILAKTVIEAYGAQELFFKTELPKDDETLAQWHARNWKNIDSCMDTLFIFIVRELLDCGDCPRRAMSIAIDDMTRVMEALPEDVKVAQ